MSICSNAIRSNSVRVKLMEPWGVLAQSGCNQVSSTRTYVQKKTDVAASVVYNRDAESGDGGRYNAGHMSKPVIIVTGAAGFIGSHAAVSFLNRGYRVIGVDNFCDFYPRAYKELNVRSVAK